MQKQTRQQLIQDHVVNPECIPEDYFCVICLGILISPVKCKTCKCKCCNNCVRKLKSQKDVCPFKCSNNYLDFQSYEEIKIKIACKFCQLQFIGTTSQLIQHLQKCEKSSYFKNIDQLRQQYLCQKRHKLTFITQDFEVMNSGLNCFQCTDNPVRAKCQTCNNYYCVKCRPPPSSKTRCPKGHKLLIKTDHHYYVCDICGQVAKSSENVYHDKKCNFGICLKCHSKQKDILINYINQHLNLCPESHPLQIRKKLVISNDKCSICLNQNKCYVQCLSCNQIYCSKCKYLNITNFKYSLNSQSFRIQLNQNEHNIQCCKCGNIQKQIYSNKKNPIVFCSKCCQSFHLKNDKNPIKNPISQPKCQNNHNLYYFDNAKNIQKLCKSCNKLKNVRYYCLQCPSIYFICLQCSPFSAQYGCLFSHTLYPSDKINKCLLCSKIQKMNQCKICNFYVCTECCDKNDHKQININENPQTFVFELQKVQTQ